MDANKDESVDKKLEKLNSNEEVSTNPDLGIKRIRTFKDDLAEAKKKAGVKDEPKESPQKKSFLGNIRKNRKKFGTVPKKTKRVQPEVPVKQKAPEPVKQPSKEVIEQELAKSGIIAKKGDTEEKQPKEDESSVSAIRTLKYDVAESVEDKQISQVKIAAAEQNRRTKRKDFSAYKIEKSSSLGMNIVYVSVSVVLVITGIWGAIYFYNQSRINADPALQTNQGVILFTNNSEDIQLGVETDVELTELLDIERQSVSADLSSITEFRLIVNTLLGTKHISAQDFTERLAFVPGRLSRALEDNFLFAVHGGGNPSPLLIFKTKDFDTTFAGMLEWESSMSRDLAPLFGESVRGSFEDVLLRNKDTRVLRNNLRQPVIVYGFPNSETLIITTNEETFFEVFERLTASNATRN